MPIAEFVRGVQVLHIPSMSENVNEYAADNGFTSLWLYAEVCVGAETVRGER